MYVDWGGCRLVLKAGDLTLDDADAIVNAANSMLEGGGGVDGAIHRRGGPSIMAECRQVMTRLGGPLPPGEAVITSAGNMKARFVIHTVGPIYDEHPDPDACLAAAYRHSLELAVDHGLKSIAFPSISTGAYGFPICLAAPIALRTVRSRLEMGRHTLREVRIVLFDAEAFGVYESALAESSRQERAVCAVRPARRTGFMKEQG